MAAMAGWTLVDEMNDTSKYDLDNSVQQTMDSWINNMKQQKNSPFEAATAVGIPNKDIKKWEQKNPQGQKSYEIKLNNKYRILFLVNNDQKKCWLTEFSESAGK